MIDILEGSRGIRPGSLSVFFILSRSPTEEHFLPGGKCKIGCGIIGEFEALLSISKLIGSGNDTPRAAIETASPVPPNSMLDIFLFEVYDTRRMRSCLEKCLSDSGVPFCREYRRIGRNEA